MFARPVDTAEQVRSNLLSQIAGLERDLVLLRSRLQSLTVESDSIASAPPPPPTPPRRRQTPRPALASTLLSILPPDGALLSIDDVISGVLAREQDNVDDRVARSKAYRRANLCLAKLRAEGRVVSHRIGSGRLDWGLNPAGSPPAA